MDQQRCSRPLLVQNHEKNHEKKLNTVSSDGFPIFTTIKATLKYSVSKIHSYVLTEIQVIL